MSKTDKTRPVAVKVLDDPNWLTEHHDHRFGPCDLGPRPTKKANVRWYGSGGRRVDQAGTPEPRCFWWYSTAYWHEPALGCGCPLCTGQLWRKAERRKDRHAGRDAVRVETRHAGVIARGSVTSLTDVDDLAGLDDAWYDPWVEEFGNGFEAEVRDNARIGAELGLTDGALVVAVDYLGGVHDPGEDSAGAERVEVTVLHNDGRREVLDFDEPWDAFHRRTH